MSDVFFSIGDTASGWFYFDGVTINGVYHAEPHGTPPNYISDPNALIYYYRTGGTGFNFAEYNATVSGAIGGTADGKLADLGNIVRVGPIAGPAIVTIHTRPHPSYGPVSFTVYQVANAAGSGTSPGATIGVGTTGTDFTFEWEYVPPPPPPPKITLTINGVDFDDLLEKQVRFELNDTGNVYFRIRRDHPDATAENLARGNLVEVRVTEIHSEVLFEAILEDGDFDLVSKDEEGGEGLAFNARGTLAYLERGILHYTPLDSGSPAHSVVPSQGIWSWHNDQAGDIFERITIEGQLRGVFAGITKTFTPTHDTDGNLWATIGDWQEDIGTNVLEAGRRLVAAGQMHMEMRPGLIFDLFQTVGVDRSGTSFGAGKVRFVKGVNIANDVGKQRKGRDYASHAIGRLANGSYVEESLPGDGDYYSERYVGDLQTSDATVASAQLQKALGDWEDEQDSVIVEHRVPWPGEETDEDNGIYLPGPTWTDHGMYWLGDLVTIHTGTGETDYDNATLRVYAITLVEDETGYLSPPIVELNAPWGLTGGEQTTFYSSRSGDSSGSTPGGGTSVNLSGYQRIDADSWKQPVRVATTANITISTGLNSGDTIDGVTLADTDRVLVKDQSTPSQNGIYIVGSTPARSSDFDIGSEIPGALVYVIAGTSNGGKIYKNTNTSEPTVGSTSLTFAEMTAAASFGTPANTYGTPAAGAASTAIRTDAVLVPPDRLVITATNKSGGSVSAGDVVRIDTTNDTAFTTGTSGQFEGTVGIAQETIANNASGKILVAGLAALVNVPASVTRGHYVETHTVAKQATGSATRRAGSFGQFLTGGTTPTAILWGQTDQTASGGSALTVKDEGSNLDTAVTSIDFTGAGVTATAVGHAISVAIPGSSGSSGSASSRDYDVSPNPTSDDQEFRAALSGWTTLGSPDVLDANATGFDSLLRIQKTATGTFQVHGLYRAIPVSGVPFTVTVRMPDYMNNANYQHHGIMLGEASPGKLFLWGPVYQSSNGTPELLAANWTNRTTRSATFTEYTGTKVLAPKYLRLVVNSNTSVDLWWSHDGAVWVQQASAWNPNMTIANIGLFVTGNDNSVAVNAAFDWMRYGTGIVIQPEAKIWQGGAGSSGSGLDYDRSPYPTADDDEFRGSLSAWTTLGSLTTLTTSDRQSHLHIKRSNAGALQLDGIYKAAPSMPFTVTMKLADYSIKRGNYTNYGLALGDATPTAWWSWTFGTFNRSLARETWTNRTTRSGSTNGDNDDVISHPGYLRLVVNSSTSVDCYWSEDGYTWNAEFTGVNPGLTVSKIGIVVQANGAEAEADIDWIRFGSDVIRTEAQTLQAIGATGINGNVLLAENIAAGAATVDFSSFISAAYDDYIIEMMDVIAGTGGSSLQLRVGTGAGPSWDSGANYNWARLYADGSSAGQGGGTGATAATLAVLMSATVPAQMTLRLRNPMQSAYPKHMFASGVQRGSDSGFYSIAMSHQEYTPTTALTGIRLLMSSGTITGTFRVYGVPKSVVGPGDYIAPSPYAGKVSLPGLDISDRVPLSPNANDDEFNSYSGWTSLGTFNQGPNVTDALSHLHIGNTSIGYAVNGIYKTAPSMPFTVITKITDWYHWSNYIQAGIMLLDSTPTALMCVGPLYGGYTTAPSDFAAGIWTNRTSRASATDVNMGLSAQTPFYVKLVVNSSTSVDCYYSANGLVWVPFITGKNPGFTVSKVGLFIAGNTNGGKAEAYFDFIRFS